VNRHRIMAYLTGLLLTAAFTAMPFTTMSAKAATTSLGHQATTMGLTSSGRIINMAKPPSWLKPNTLVRPLVYISPDTLYGNYQICDADEQCINNWNGGGEGNLIRWFTYAEGRANNEFNWWYEGTVGDGDDWPFTAGSGINTDYAGDSVFKFAFAPGGKGSGLCVSQSLFGDSDTLSNVNLVGCVCSTCQTEASAKTQYFVFDPVGRLIAVGATNDYIVGAGDSGRVWVGVSPSDPTDANAAYVYLVTSITYAVTGFGAFARSGLKVHP
jgi:hypothetical protein